ncbi:uncharacterized protein [Amphiura filiformis]|uniref:uncharacterized protein n=1 Tax=Amphiura filiformis TaxID=82378 RepID=UPI003B221531
MEDMYNVSTKDTSGSSTASSVLINATSIPRESDKQHDISGSSFSSSSSQRVCIKAKYLKEIKSPFDAAAEGNTPSEYVPPVLPGNRPKGYQAGGTQHHLRSSAGIQKERKEGKRGEQLGTVLNHSGETYKDDNVACELLEAVNTSGQSIKGKGTVEPTGHSSSAVFKTPASSSSSVVKQGAPSSGLDNILTQWTVNGTANDLRITQFAPTGRQRVMKEQLLKRQEHSGPVKRFVQPRMVSSSIPISQEQTEKTIKDGTDGTMSVAAATAAAVAATAPMVKVQSDLEHKMNAIMEKLSSLEESRHQSQPHLSASQGYMHELQNKLEEVTQSRLNQLERMQERQMEWQAKLLTTQPYQHNQAPVMHASHQEVNAIPSNVRQNLPQSGQATADQLSQSSPAVYPMTETPASGRRERTKLVHGQPNSPRVHNHQHVGQRTHHTRTSESHPTSIRHGASKRSTNQAPTRKHVKYAPAITLHKQQSPQGGGSPGEVIWKEKERTVGMEHGTQTSPLDTPAPRRHAPVPLSQDPPRISHLGRGLLEEILTSHDEEEREK